MVKKKNFLRVLTPTEVEVNNPFDQALHHKEEVGVEGELLCSTVNTTTNGGYYRQQKPTSSLGKIYTKSGTMFQHSSRTSSVPSSSTYSSCDKRIVFIKNPTKIEVGGATKALLHKFGEINAGFQHSFYSSEIQNTFSTLFSANDSPSKTMKNAFYFI